MNTILLLFNFQGSILHTFCSGPRSHIQSSWAVIQFVEAFYEPGRSVDVVHGPRTWADYEQVWPFAMPSSFPLQAADYKSAEYQSPIPKLLLLVISSRWL